MTHGRTRRVRQKRRRQTGAGTEKRDKVNIDMQQVGNIAASAAISAVISTAINKAMQK